MVGAWSAARCGPEGSQAFGPATTAGGRIYPLKPHSRPPACPALRFLQKIVPFMSAPHLFLHLQSFPSFPFRPVIAPSLPFPMMIDDDAEDDGDGDGDAQNTMVQVMMSA